MQLTIVMNYFKDTKNKYVYQEEDTGQERKVVESIYINKHALPGKRPEKIVVTIEAPTE